MYSIFVILNRKPLESKMFCQIYNMTFTACLVSFTDIIKKKKVSFTETISFAKSIDQWTSSWIKLVSSSITNPKRYEHNASPWCKPVVMGNSFVMSPLVLTLVIALSYTYPINLIYFRRTHFFSKTHHIISLGNLPYVVYRSKNSIGRSLQASFFF